jgi:uncharacterized protein involved in exopolysaccharide biosynthesis
VISVITDQITRQARFAPPSASSDLSLFTIVEIFFRHLKVFLLVAGLVFAAALWWTFGTPKRYESSASILVQNARGNVQITSGNTEGPSEMRDVTEEQMNSDLEVLTSRDLLDEVVKPGWKSKPRDKYSRAELVEHERAVAGLKDRLETTIGRLSNVILAKVSAPSPDQAQEEMRRLIAGFMARQRQISRPPGATHFFAEQAERYKNELALAQAELAQFQNQQNLVNINDRESTLSSNVTNAENLRRETDVQIHDIERRVQADAALLETLPKRQTTQEHSTPLTGALDQLTTQLVTLKNQRTELLNKYPPTDRAVRQIELQIAEIEAGIAGAASPRSRDAATDVNPTWQQLQTDVTMTRSQLSGLLARRDALSSQIAKSQADLNVTEGLSPQFTALQHKVAELDSNYQAYLQKRDQAEVADSMDREDLVNFAVVEAPTYSMYPVHPRPKRDTFLGLMTALLLGGVAVFLMESVRETIGGARELEQWSGRPVLATVPWLQEPASAVDPDRSLSMGSQLSDEEEAELAGKARRLAYLRTSSED